MNFLTIFIALIALSTSLLFSQADISHEIAKLKHANESQRYIIMNRIKQQLAGMNTRQRAAAIAQLRNKANTGNHASRSQAAQRNNHQNKNRNSSARGRVQQPSSGYRGSGRIPHGTPQIPVPAAPSMPQGGHITAPPHSNPGIPPHTGPQQPPHTGPGTPPTAPPGTGPQTPPHTGPHTPAPTPPGSGPQTSPHTGPQTPPPIPGPRPGRY